jgi:hypothetical protein|tara:strand:- start:1236 stop:1469 length:234 start_codon:yes stop_codon:yes gene_type:complete
MTEFKTVVKYKGHTVDCYGKLKEASTIIYAMSNGCEGHTDNYNYETGEHFLDWESFVKDWVELEGVDEFNVVQLEVD